MLKTRIVVGAVLIGLVAGMPARSASLGIVRSAKEEQRRLEIAVDLFLRSLRP